MTNNTGETAIYPLTTAEYARIVQNARKTADALAPLHAETDRLMIARPEELRPDFLRQQREALRRYDTDARFHARVNLAAALLARLRGPANDPRGAGTLGEALVLLDTLDKMDGGK